MIRPNIPTPVIRPRRMFPALFPTTCCKSSFSSLTTGRGEQRALKSVVLRSSSPRIPYPLQTASARTRSPTTLQRRAFARIPRSPTTLQRRAFAQIPSLHVTVTRSPTTLQRRAFAQIPSLHVTRSPTTLQRRSFAQVPSLHVTRKLSDIVKLPLLQREDAKKVREIWLYQQKPKVINGVMAEPEFRIVTNNARAHPLFVVPIRPDPNVDVLKKDQDKNFATTSAAELGTSDDKSDQLFRAANTASSGFYNLVSEWKGNEIIFTALEDFQKDQINAVPYLVVNLFPDLLASHKLVLLRADIISPLISRRQAEGVIRYLRECYVHEDRYSWVKKFNQRPREFDYGAWVRFMGARGG